MFQNSFGGENIMFYQRSESLERGILYIGYPGIIYILHYTVGSRVACMLLCRRTFRIYATAEIKKTL